MKRREHQRSKHKDAKICVGRSMTVHKRLFWAHARSVMHELSSQEVSLILSCSVRSN